MLASFSRSLVRTPRTLAAWVFVSLLIMLVHILLPRTYAFDLTALLLTVVAAIYIGFALNDGRPKYVVTEVAAASVFILFAVGGLWLNPYLWPLGLALHGVWDLLHHEHGVQTRVPRWYPPICVVVDGLLALFLVLWL